MKYGEVEMLVEGADGSRVWIRWEEWRDMVGCGDECVIESTCGTRVWSLGGWMYMFNRSKVDA